MSNLPYYTEEELNAPIQVQKISVFGTYTARGDHRKEIVQRDFEEFVTVPVAWNKGQLKLATNNHIKKVLKGIRVRTFEVNEEVEPKEVKKKYLFKDFISDSGLRHNKRRKEHYLENLKKNPDDEPASGVSFARTELGPDGLPKFSERTYVV